VLFETNVLTFLSTFSGIYSELISEAFPAIRSIFCCFVFLNIALAIPIAFTLQKRFLYNKRILAAIGAMPPHPSGTPPKEGKPKTTFVFNFAALRLCEEKST